MYLWRVSCRLISLVHFTAKGIGLPVDGWPSALSRLTYEASQSCCGHKPHISAQTANSSLISSPGLHAPCAWFRCHPRPYVLVGQLPCSLVSVLSLLAFHSPPHEHIMAVCSILRICCPYATIKIPNLLPCLILWACRGRREMTRCWVCFLWSRT